MKVNDVIHIWQAASLPSISCNRTQTPLKSLVAKFEGTASSKEGVKGVSEDWLDTIFDIYANVSARSQKLRKYLMARLRTAAHGNTEFHKRR